MSDDVIDLGQYRAERGDARAAAFSVWGGEGDRARLALPLWRAIYLAEGQRGGLVWAAAAPDHPERLRPFFVLDLGVDPARIDFDPTLVRTTWGRRSPTVSASEGGVAVHLGEADGRRWFLLVTGPAVAGRSDLPSGVREDLLFLAGECAGLLFHRELAVDADEGSAPEG